MYHALHLPRQEFHREVATAGGHRELAGHGIESALIPLNGRRMSADNLLATRWSGAMTAGMNP